MVVAYTDSWGVDVICFFLFCLRIAHPANKGWARSMDLLLISEAFRKTLGNAYLTKLNICGLKVCGFS